MRRPLTATALALSFALVAACGGDDDDGGGGGTGDAGLATVTGGLAAFPDTGADEQVAWSDLAAAREVAGLDRPAADETDAVTDYVTAMIGARPDTSSVAVVPPEAANVMRSADVTEFADEVGWSFVDIDRFAERQVPPDVVTVLQGDVDTDAVSDAADERDGDTWVVGDPDGGTDLASSSPARPLGEPMFMAEAGGSLVVTSGDDDTGAVVDALSGDADGATLADDQGLGALGAALDEAGAYSALLVRPGMQAGVLDAAGPEAAAAACESALPSPTIATATGITDDDGPVLLVAHAHDAAGAAEANAEALEQLVTEGTSLSTRQPYSELVTLDGVEVTGEDDTVAIARLRPVGDTPARLWVDMLFRREGIAGYC